MTNYETPLNFDKIIWTPTDVIAEDKLDLMAKNDDYILNLRHLNAKGILESNSSSSNKNVSSSTPSSLLSITTTIEKNRYIGIGCNIPYFDEQAATPLPAMGLYIDGVVDVASYTFPNLPNADSSNMDGPSFHFWYIKAGLESGSHTFDIRVWNNGSGNYLIMGSPDLKIFSWVEDLGCEKQLGL
jgi:hypothetical protein